MITFTGPVGQPTYNVLTASTSDSIPNLSAAGLGLPPATNYSWRVLGFAPFASADAAAGPTGFLGGFITLPSADAAVGISATRNFTTAP